MLNSKLNIYLGVIEMVNDNDNKTYETKKNSTVLYAVLTVMIVILAVAFGFTYSQLGKANSSLEVVKGQLIEAEQKLQETKASDIMTEDTESKTGLSLVEVVYISSYANDANKNTNVTDLNRVIIRDGVEEVGTDGKVITYKLQNEDFADLVITVNSDDILIDASIQVYDSADKTNVVGSYKLSDDILEKVVSLAKSVDSSENMYSKALTGMETPESAK